MNTYKLQLERELREVEDFHVRYTLLKSLKNDPTHSPDQKHDLERECKHSMIRVLLSNHPISDESLDFSKTKMARFLQELNAFGDDSRDATFPSVKGTYWNWPPSQEFLDFVEATLYQSPLTLKDMSWGSD